MNKFFINHSPTLRVHQNLGAIKVEMEPLPSQPHLLPGVGEAIRKMAASYKMIIASNQPGIAKGHMSEETFDGIREKMKAALARDGAFLEAEYYCLHHPEAKVESLRQNCECRKPNPGLLLKAAQDLDIDLSQSWMVGDGLTDVQAGRAAGCHTMLLGRMKCEVCHLMEEENARPDAITANLNEAAKFILKTGG